VEDADHTEAELRAELAAQGVNVETFLTRLGQEAGIKPANVKAKKPTAAERLRALANRTESKVKGFLSGLNVNDAADMPAAAYGRSGDRNKRTRTSSSGKRGGKTGD
jgi:hypothetical protein